MEFSQAAANLVQGSLIGLFIAVPVGPSSILCIQRSLSRGLLIGIATGAGIATVHGSYAAVALQGSRSVAGFVAAHADTLRIGSVILLFVFAVRALLSSTPSMEVALAEASLPLPASGRGGVPQRIGIAEGRRRIRAGQAYGSAVLFASMNPVTIFFFLGVIPTMLAIGDPGPAAGSAWWLVVGVTLGSLGWWTLVVVAVRLASRFLISDRSVRLVNRASAVSLALMALALLLPALRGWSDPPPVPPFSVVEGEPLDSLTGADCVPGRSVESMARLR
jgi:threonine/homoserine/homoserine lactone efflux protein